MVWVMKRQAGADSYGNVWPEDGSVIDVPVDEADVLVHIKDGGFSLPVDYEPDPEPEPPHAPPAAEPDAEPDVPDPEPSPVDEGPAEPANPVVEAPASRRAPNRRKN